jgi:GNAT superfamily N-acetyltransferase
MRERQSAIRKAASIDSAGILECLRAAFEPYRDSYTPEAFVDTVLTPQTIEERFRSMCLFVAVSESGEIVGTIGCQVVASEVGQEKEGHIRGMAVLPGWQGSGVATQLLNAVESELRNQGCSRISLDTTQPLRQAMRFYEKNSFERSGRVTSFFGMPLFEYVKRLED